jgi:hypothetical protein
MAKTIVALYDDIVMARQVVEDLVNADFPRTSISLITNDANNQYSHYLDKDYAPRQDAVTAGEGAGFGAAVGGLTGILVGLAALTIPGIGLAIAAGPIVAGLTGALAGAVTGGVVGALVKSGVPEDEAPYYAEGIRRGGTLVSIETSDTLRAEGIMNRHGSINIHERINLWRHDGWEGFNYESDAIEHAEAAKSSTDMLTEITTDTTTTTTTTRVTPGTPDASPATVEPFSPVVDEEGPLEYQPTYPTTDSTSPVNLTPDVVTDKPDPQAVEGEPQIEHETPAKAFPKD